ncbi:SCO family protein [Candidatus Poribacteria bacterium]|nr:SCO family protein [Candidatus Poribacteria bacterium]
MANRREVLAGLAAGAAAVSGVALGVPTTTAAENKFPDGCREFSVGPNADYFPNVTVQTHENQKALFYDDFLRDKTVMINCMSVKNDSVYPVTENLVKVQRLLGNRVGRDVFMYSITVDPENDTPRVLRAFAEKHGVGPGWLFLTGETEVIEGLRGRLFAHSGGHVHGLGPTQDCSLGLIQYGNEAIGLWGSVPSKASPEWIVERLSWLTPRQRSVGPPKRRGPVAMAWTQQSSRIQDNS